MSANKPDHKPELEYRACPPDIEAYIDHIDSWMMDPEYDHDGVPLLMITDFLYNGEADSLGEIEGWLRQRNSRVSLVALPLDYGGLDLSRYVSYLPGKRGKPEYRLWIGIDGGVKAAEIMAELGITPYQNLDRLEKTGFVL